MKLVFDRTELNSAMQLLQSVAMTKSSLPILANVLIDVEDDVAVLTATDLQVSVRLRVDAHVEESGSATLPAAKLAAFVRELPDDHVRIEKLDGRQIAVQCGKVVAKLPGIAADEFPRIDTADRFDFTVKAGDLQELIRCTKFAVASEETRYVLNAVYFQAFDDRLCSVATDSMRLAVKSVDVEGLGGWGEAASADSSADGEAEQEEAEENGNGPVEEAEPEAEENGGEEAEQEAEEEEQAEPEAAPAGEQPKWSALLPTKAADELLRAFEPDDELRVGTAQRENSPSAQIVFDSGGKTLISRLQDGNYVEYRELIPKNNSIRMEVNRGSLMNAIRRISQFSDRSTLRLTLSVKEDHLALSSISASGQAEEEINAASTEPLDIDFKHTFLADALEAARSEVIYVDFKDHNSAAVVRESDADDYLCVVMPLMK
ncbi:MAG: DNA polymerase III subunit beta [Candidatus Poribacteria bacterium]|nr:DNA polymerase III subunit beta [Candidatus Poribacteria bacterium]